MNMPNNEKIKLMRDFLHSEKTKLCVISTVDNENQPNSVVVYYASDDDLGIYFVTRVGSNKYKNIILNPKVSFLVYDETKAESLQIHGTASVVTDVNSQKDLFSKLVTLAAERHFIPPIGQMMNSEIMFMKINPTRARFARFSIPRASNTNIFEEVVFE